MNIKEVESLCLAGDYEALKTFWRNASFGERQTVSRSPVFQKYLIDLLQAQKRQNADQEIKTLQERLNKLTAKEP